MFYAQTIEGRRVHANDYDRTQPLICPGCRARVYLKSGNKNVTHFAHYANSDCQQFSEGESQRHLLGKQLLYSWIKSQNIKVELEAWLPEMKQRPDLLLEIDHRRIALEYQCSPIPYKKLKERTQGYQNHGYEIYWICGIDYFPHERLRDKTRMFLQKNGSLVCLDSVNGLVYQFGDFQFNKYNKLTWVQQIKNISLLNVTEFEKLYCDSIERRVLEKTTMPYPKQISLLYKKDQRHRDFLSDLYVNQHALANLPVFLFTLPNKTLVYQIPAYMWKYAFLNQLQSRLTYSQVQTFIEKLPRYETLFYKEEPLLDFIKELEARNILKRIGKKEWQVSSFPLRNK